MPRIQLKPNSPEFLDLATKTHTLVCEMPDCKNAGGYRAPKDRNLESYYSFCQEHAREYNRAWNFFADMSDIEMQQHLYESLYGFRPTRKSGIGEDAMEELYRKAWQTYHFSEKDPSEHKRENKTYRQFPDEQSHEAEALKIMGLTPPLTLDEIKARYKTLAKRYHPDRNPDDREAEEFLKQVNMAYTILKVAYEAYQNLPARESDKP